jgi:hypothetical protein
MYRRDFPRCKRAANTTYGMKCPNLMTKELTFYRRSRSKLDRSEELKIDE